MEICRKRLILIPRVELWQQYEIWNFFEVESKPPFKQWEGGDRIEHKNKLITYVKTDFSHVYQK